MKIQMKRHFVSIIVLVLATHHRSSEMVNAKQASPGLVDPAIQNFFTTTVPNALDPAFFFDLSSSSEIEISVGEGTAETGIIDSDGTPLITPIWGYGTSDLGYTWPGRTFQVQSNQPLRIRYHNRIPIESGYLLTGKDNGELHGNFEGVAAVDTSVHWAYSIPGYEDYTIEKDGTPIVPHLHGGHADYLYDGNPEYFFTPEFGVTGPQWTNETYLYDNSQKAGSLWLHDHALGITRLNVYTGMAAFYFVRDEEDTGTSQNTRKLPAFPYELAYAIQDRMFKENGELFYPAFKGDPFHDDFIAGEDAIVTDDSPTALAEVFGDIMLVNGKAWPKVDVEPRHYRLRLLNGCDSRFLVIQFVGIDLGQTTFDLTSATPVPFTVIGGDQGFADRPTQVTTLVISPAARYDIVVDFTPYDQKRLVMVNLGGDEPFGGDIPGPQVFEFTDRIMAFDVQVPFDVAIPDDFEDETTVAVEKEELPVDNVRRLGLFEGHDNFNRLMPLLGTIDPATDMDGNPINWPNTAAYREIGLVGQMKGTANWHHPTTENVRLGDTEDWEIWNLSADAHPIHLHMVQFSLVSRQTIAFDSLANEEGEIEPGNPAAGDGTYYTDMPLLQHDGTLGEGYYAVNPTYGDAVNVNAELPEYVANYPADVVVALPGQITTIRATFDKPGRFNWHCHILAHEDHDMMRLYHVGELPEDQKSYSDGLEHGDDFTVSSTNPPSTSNRVAVVELATVFAHVSLLLLLLLVL